MFRQDTARKHTTLELSAIRADDYSKASNISREDPSLSPAMLGRPLGNVMCLVLVLMPIHYGLYQLAEFSLPFAFAVTLGMSLCMLTFAAARKLGLDDLIDKLPLVAALVVVVVAVVYLLPARPQMSLQGWVDPFGSVVVLVLLASVLASFHKPLSAGYNALVWRTTAKEHLCGALSLAVSFAVIASSHILPGFALTLLATSSLGALAAIVVYEYQAWCRANPNLELFYIFRFSNPKFDPEQATDSPPTQHLDPKWGRAAIKSGILLGLGVGIVSVASGSLSPTSELFVWLTKTTGDTPHSIREAIGTFVGFGLLLILFALICGTTDCDGGGIPNPPRSMWIASKALLNFWAYPHETHPLGHRMQLKWLRPVEARLGLTAFVFLLIATSVLVSDRPRNLASITTTSVTPTKVENGGTKPATRNSVSSKESEVNPEVARILNPRGLEANVGLPAPQSTPIGPQPSGLQPAEASTEPSIVRIIGKLLYR